MRKSTYLAASEPRILCIYSCTTAANGADRQSINVDAGAGAGAGARLTTGCPRAVVAAVERRPEAEPRQLRSGGWPGRDGPRAIDNASVRGSHAARGLPFVHIRRQLNKNC